MLSVVMVSPVLACGFSSIPMAFMLDDLSAFGDSVMHLGMMLMLYGRTRYTQARRIKDYSVPYKSQSQ